MLGLGKSKNLKNFEKIVRNMGKDELIPISMSVYSCWKLFNIKYDSVQVWLKSNDNKIEWITFLDGLAKDQLEKEMAGDLPFGTTSGVYLSIFFFKAVALNEGDKTINSMSEHMEKFNRIGFQIAQGINKT